MSAALIEKLSDAAARELEQRPASRPTSERDMLFLLYLASRHHGGSLPAEKSDCLVAACQVVLDNIEADFSHEIARGILIILAAGELLEEVDRRAIEIWVRRMIARKFAKNGEAMLDDNMDKIRGRVGDHWKESVARKVALRAKGEVIGEKVGPFLPAGHALNPHQLEAVALLREWEGKGVLSHEMGLGKTITALGFFILERALAAPMVVICPASVVGSWIVAAREWLSKLGVVCEVIGRDLRRGWDQRKLYLRSVAKLRRAVRRKRIRRLNTVKARIDAIRRAYPEASKVYRIGMHRRGPHVLDLTLERNEAEWERWKLRPRIYVGSWSQLVLHSGWIAGLQPQMVVGDELHDYMRTRDSKTTRAFWQIRLGVPFVIGLTGTMRPNGRPADAWAIMKAVRPTIVLPWREYGNLFCGPEKIYLGYEYNPRTRKKQRKVRTSYKGRSNELRYAGLIRQVMLRLTKEQVPGVIKADLRRRSREVLFKPKDWVRVAMAEDEARARILELAETARVNLELEDADEEVVATKVAAIMGAKEALKITRLRIVVGLCKAERAADYFTEIMKAGKRPLVFCAHHEVARACESTLSTMGEVRCSLDWMSSPAKRQDLVEWWERPRGDALVLTGAFGTGVTLVSSSHVVMVERFWDPAREGQCEARAHRIGQDDDVMVDYLLAPGTVDDHVSRLNTWKDEGVRCGTGEIRAGVVKWLMSGWD